MNVREGSRARPVVIALGSFVMAGVVGYVDARSSAYIAFSVFYLIPVFASTWFVNRAVGVAVAVACAAFGLAADVWTTGSEHVYAYTNLCLRLLLFISAAVVIDLVHRSIAREQAIADHEREAAARLERATKMQEEVMRSVAHGAWEPLSEIHAKIVDLQFELTNLSDADTRAALNEIAQASLRLSALVDTLLQQHPVEVPVGLARTDPTR